MRTRFDTLLKRAARTSEPDGGLLRRFADTRDEAAFAELVRRYGRLVWGQCRNLLPNEADADDAFQATFLTLAKSVKTIRDANRLGPWLHGVAYRVCQNAKRVSARRKKRERGSAPAEAGRPVADSAWDAALAAVHDELHQLPDTLRVPFILCCLEGKGTSEAAEQLGLKLGTFSARLTRAKQTLLDRLSARGLTAGVVALTAVTGGATTAPAATVARAVGLATTTGAIPSGILSLTHGVLTMTAWNTKLLAAAVLAACGLAAGLGGGWTANAQDPKPKREEVKDDKDKKIEELRALVEQARRQTEQAALQAKQAAEAERRAKERAEAAQVEAERALVEAKLRADKADARKAEEGKAKATEFKYFGQLPNFAPTADELEALVKRGEEGGYKFIGITNMRGMTKQGDGVVPTLVFRRESGLRLTNVLDIQHDLAAKLPAEAALSKVAEAKDKVKEKLTEVANDKMKDVIRKADVEMQEALKKGEAVLKEKLKGVQDIQPKVADKAKEKVIEDVIVKKEADAKAQAEIDALRAKIAELEAKTTKKPAKGSAKFTASDLGKGDFDHQAKLLAELVRSKFGDDAAKKLTVTIDPRDKMVVADGDEDAVKWLQDAVKLLKQPAKGGGPK